MSFSTTTNGSATKNPATNNGDLAFRAFNMRKLLSAIFGNQTMTPPQQLESGSENRIFRFYRNSELHEIVTDHKGYLWRFSQQISGVVTRRFAPEEPLMLIEKIAEHFRIPPGQVERR